MLTKTSCLICGENDWRILGQRTYTELEGKSCSPYKQKRFKVLFHKWFPDKESITLTSILCRHCGFIIYTPRPENDDIDSKYKYLEALGQDYGLSSLDSQVERKRSETILRYLNKNMDFRKVTKVLDYGGGDGRLMSAFLNIGKQCYLVDYNKNCAQGVTKLSDTITDVDPRKKFDLIVCSHVIEHLAQPLQILMRLAFHLKQKGYLFIEVPMEVWKRPPLAFEPVTHVNFFTPNSLHNLLLISGFAVIRSQMVAGLHPSGEKKHVIRSIARKVSQPQPFKNLKLLHPDGIEYLKPNIFNILRYHMCVPLEIPKVLWGRGRRLLR